MNGKPHGCSNIRLLRPLNHESLEKLVHVNSDIKLSEKTADVVIVERWWKPSLTESDARSLIQEIRARNSTFIYTLDDNLLDLGDAEASMPPPENINRIVRYFLREADGVIVSTPALKMRLSRLANNIIVIPNALDETLWLKMNAVEKLYSNFESSELGKITVGYMGTKTHSSDFDMLIEPLRRLLARHPNRIRLQVIGVSSEQERFSKIFGNKIEFFDPGYSDHYEKFVPWFRKTVKWDIGLAPLTEHPFNLYKSDIKLLDYGIAGIPGIFSSIGPYSESVLHKETGILTDNHPDSWFEAMNMLVENEPMRKRIAENVKDYVLSKRILKVCAVDWYSTIKLIHDNRLSSSTNQVV
nr:hypothetical protein [Methylomarinum sp. Ch1-1]MDP4522853.1 hypothetical protein [Methylomarinum sp. Ch1-1]